MAARTSQPAGPLIDVRPLARRPVATGSLILAATAPMIMMLLLGTLRRSGATRFTPECRRRTRRGEPAIQI